MTVDNWIDAVNEGETTDGYDEWSKANAKPRNIYVIRKVSDRTKFWARKESNFGPGWTSLERASVYVSTKGTSRRPSDEYEFVKLTKATA